MITKASSSGKLLPFSATHSVLVKNKRSSRKHHPVISKVETKSRIYHQKSPAPRLPPCLPSPLPSPPSLLPLCKSDAVRLLAASTLGFSFLAGDVFFWHATPLQHLDWSIHLLVQQDIPTEVQQTLARRILSNTPIVLGWIGWAGALASLSSTYILSSNTSTQQQENSNRALRYSTIAAAAAFFGGGGTLQHGDSWLVDTLKHFFHRVRPPSGLLSSTFSFPSGHTTAATFVVGVFLFLLLPLAVEGVVVSSQKTSSSSSSSETVDTVVKTRPSRWWTWMSLVGCTASGRVLADVHWTTDVLGGLCVGVFLVAATALACGASDALFDDEERL